MPERRTKVLLSGIFCYNKEKLADEHLFRNAKSSKMI